MPDDGLGAELATEYGALHGGHVALPGVVSRQKEIGDRGGLAGAQLLTTGRCLVDRQGGLHHPVLAQLSGVIPTEMAGEQGFQLFHGDLDNVLVRAADPVLRRGKDQLQHGALRVFIALAGDAHVRIDTEQGGTAEQKMVNVRELTVKPKVNVDDGDTLETSQPGKGRELSPWLWQEQLEHIHRQGADIGIRHNAWAVLAPHVKAGHLTIGGQVDGPQGCAELHGAPTGTDVVHQWLAEPLRRRPIQKRHAGAVLFLQKAVQGREHHGGGDLIRIDEVEGLAHGNEHLVIDPFRDVVQP